MFIILSPYWPFASGASIAHRDNYSTSLYIRRGPFCAGVQVQGKSHVSVVAGTRSGMMVRAFLSFVNGG